MTILFVNTLYHPHEVGGAERSVRTMAEQMVDKGHAVTVVCTHREDRLTVKDVAGVQVVYVPGRNIFYPHGVDDLPFWVEQIPARLLWHSVDTYNPRMTSDIGRMIEVVDPDVVHTNNLTGLSTAVWSEAKDQGYPTVHTLRDYYLLCHRATMYRDGSNCGSVCWHCKPFACARLHMTRNVDAVVGISRSILDAHLARGGFEQTSARAIIPNPYDGVIQRPRERDEDSPLQVGFLGRIVPSKGLDVLLEAVQRSPEDVEVHVGGTDDSGYIESIKKSYPLSNVTYHGYVDPASFLPGLDVLVVPSRWREPLGRVVFEAYANGVPVLGADRGGIPEMIESGETGYIFDPSEVDELVRLLNVLRSNPTQIEEMSTSAYNHATRYHPDVIVDEYLDIYSRVLS